MSVVGKENSSGIRRIRYFEVFLDSATRFGGSILVSRYVSVSI